MIQCNCMKYMTYRLCKSCNDIFPNESHKSSCDQYIPICHKCEALGFETLTEVIKTKGHRSETNRVPNSVVNLIRGFALKPTSMVGKMQRIQKREENLAKQIEKMSLKTKKLNTPRFVKKKLKYFP